MTLSEDQVLKTRESLTGIWPSASDWLDENDETFRRGVQLFEYRAISLAVRHLRASDVEYEADDDLLTILLRAAEPIQERLNEQREMGGNPHAPEKEWLCKDGRTRWYHSKRALSALKRMLEDPPFDDDESRGPIRCVCGRRYETKELKMEHQEIHYPEYARNHG